MSAISNISLTHSHSYLQASDRVRVNIRKINTDSFVKNYGVMSQISKNICANNGIAHNNPLDIE